MYYRVLMYALGLISPEMFLILVLYRLNLSQFCLKFVWTSNYLIKIKEIISKTVVVLLFLFCYLIFFFFLILVLLTIQCNNSYHPEKHRAVKFIILLTGGRSTSITLCLVLLLQFKVMLSSDKHEKNLSTRLFIRILTY